MQTRSKILATIVVAVIAGGVWYWLGNRTVSPTQDSAGYKNATYTIEGMPVTLINGHAETSAAPGSAARVVTSYFGNETTGDLNGDGVPDTAFILSQDTGGSGTFFYVVVARKTATGYEGTNAVFLGDRIAPQTTEIKDGRLVVNYADRAAGEPMMAQPSVGVSKYLQLQGSTLVEVPSTVSVWKINH